MGANNNEAIDVEIERSKIVKKILVNHDKEENYTSEVQNTKVSNEEVLGDGKALNKD